MAKLKKQDLTKEGLLEQALVLEDEQPYKVPINWVWTKARYGFEITSSKRVHKNDWKSDGVPFYRTRELVVLSDKGYVDNELFITENMYQEFKETYGVPAINDLLISGVGTIGVPYIVKDDDKFYFKDGNIIWFQNNGLFNAEYVYYLYKSLFMKIQLLDFSSGTTVDTYTIINAKETMIPLPPHTEQQRIVDRIKSLFAKLDHAKEMAQNALDTFETRKAAILHKAFTGELTAKWREKNGAEMDSWNEFKLKNVCSKITDGTHKSPKNYDVGDFMYVTAKNIKERGIDLSNITYVSQKDHDEIYPRCNVEPGDVLYIKDGATTGIATINTLDVPFSLLSSVALLKPNRTLLDSKYLVWNLNSPNTKSLMLNNMSGNAITRLTLKKIQEASIIVPSLPEQQEIVRILDSLFEKEQKAKELCDIIDKIALMKKAILARAFRGELGTNDPTEESAIKLLKDVIANK